jgi:hypothetical protein
MLTLDPTSGSTTAVLGGHNSHYIRTARPRAFLPVELTKPNAIVDFVHSWPSNHVWLNERAVLLSIYLISSSTQLDREKLTKLTKRFSFRVSIGKKVRTRAIRSSSEPKSTTVKEKKNYQSSLVRRAIRP